MKKLNATLLLLGLAFLAFLVWHAGPQKLLRQVGDLGWGILLLVLVEGAGNLAHTIGWRHCISQSQRRIPLLRLFRIAVAGYAINYLTPTASIGGDVSRAALLAQTCRGPEAASSVLLDKLMTAIAHLALVLFGLAFLFWKITLPTQLWVAMLVTTILLSSGIAAFLFLQKLENWAGLAVGLYNTAWAASAFNRPRNASRKLTKHSKLFIASAQGTWFCR